MWCFAPRTDISTVLSYIHHLSDVDDNTGPEAPAATAGDAEAEQEGKADTKDSEMTWFKVREICRYQDSFYFYFVLFLFL